MLAGTVAVALTISEKLMMTGGGTRPDRYLRKRRAHGAAMPFPVRTPYAPGTVRVTSVPGGAPQARPESC